MKKIIVGIAAVMLLVLVSATVYNEKSIDGIEVMHQNKLAQKQALEDSQQQIKEQEQRLQPTHPGKDNQNIGYSLQKEQLQITYDSGGEWIKVPIDKSQLFSGEYNGNEQELIPQSYILTDKLAAFLYVTGELGADQQMMLTYSRDKGKTWQDIVVTNQLTGVRFRKVDFLNEKFGYVILSGDRTMSQEYATAYVTYDGGENWKHAGNPDVTRLISDGGFVDEKTGFMSYGTINPEKPDLYVTVDGGETWQQSMVKVPKKYDKIFVQAEVPYKEKDHLAMEVNQGPNGDYLGGEVQGKFISKDNGKTWQFVKEVRPDEA